MENTVEEMEEEEKYFKKEMGKNERKINREKIAKIFRYRRG